MLSGAKISCSTSSNQLAFLEASGFEGVVGKDELETVASVGIADVRAMAGRVAFLPFPLRRALMVFFQAGLGASLEILAEGAGKGEREDFVDSTRGLTVSVSWVVVEVSGVSSVSIVHA